MAAKVTNRPYTAVKIELVPQAIKTLNMTARKDFTIPGTNGGFVAIRAGEKFTVVRSDSLGEDIWYLVRQVSGCKKCSCPAMKPCKHEKSVNIPQPSRTFRIVVEGKTFYYPQYREGNKDWTFFKDEAGQDLSFIMAPDLAKKFIQEDSDANRERVLAAYHQVLDKRSTETRAWQKAQEEERVATPQRARKASSLKNHEAQSNFFMSLPSRQAVGV